MRHAGRPLAALAAAALAATAGGGCGDGEDDSTSARIERLTGSAQPAPLAVLRGAPEPLPRAARAAIAGSPTQRDLGLRLDGAQRVRTRIGERLWVLPGEQGVCIVRDRTGQAGCETNRRLAREGFTLALPEPAGQTDPSSRHYVVFGLAPDGVRTVRLVRSRTRSTLRVRVRDNVYSYVGWSPIRVRLDRPAG